MNVPFELLRLARRNHRVRVRRRRRLARGAHDHAGGLDDQAAILTLHLIPQRHLDAIALVGTEHQRLNRIALVSGRHRTRIESVFFPRFFVLGFLGANLVDLPGMDVHIPGIEVEPPVQTDFDVDHRNVVLLHRRIGGTFPP